MKTITAEQAATQFEKYSKLAHDGQKLLVTLRGEPWVILSPAPAPPHHKPGSEKRQWPDFAARLAAHYSEPVEGPTATELLAQDREDRF